MTSRLVKTYAERAFLDMHSVCKMAPAGIDIFARKQWARARKFGQKIRSELEQIKRDFDDPEMFAYAAGRYIEGLEESMLKPPVLRFAPALCRLARAHAHRIRKELARDPELENRRRFIAAAQRLAVMGQHL
jgi:hypothetical protein